MNIGGTVLIDWALRKQYSGVKLLADDAAMSGLAVDIGEATRAKRIILRALL